MKFSINFFEIIFYDFLKDYCYKINPSYIKFSFFSFSSVSFLAIYIKANNDMIDELSATITLLKYPPSKKPIKDAPAVTRAYGN